MKFYRCVTPTDRLCPCGRVARALKEVGIAFDQERGPASRAPNRRGCIIELTGQPLVPVVLADDGTAMFDSARILEAIRATSVPGQPR